MKVDRRIRSLVKIDRLVEFSRINVEENELVWVVRRSRGTFASRGTHSWNSRMLRDSSSRKRPNENNLSLRDCTYLCMLVYAHVCACIRKMYVYIARWLKTIPRIRNTGGGKGFYSRFKILSNKS